jgi:hypothetical protein
MFIIKRTDQGGGYVAKPGSKKSYTNKVKNMRKFDSEEEAERERCPGNEMVLPIATVIC